MQAIRFLSNPAWQRLALTLLHFLWQGAIVAAVAVAVVRLLRLRSGPPRYAAYLIALVAIAACPVVTFWLVEPPAPMEVPAAPPPTEVAIPPGQAPPPMDAMAPLEGIEMDAPPPEVPLALDTPRERPLAAPAGPAEAGEAPAEAPRSALAQHLSAAPPWVAAAWLLGVIVLSGRLLLGVAGAYRWRRRLEPLPGHLTDAVAALSERMGLRGFARVFISPLAAQPMVAGYLRPMVLLPAAMLTGLPPEMLEAVIAHELAHIRRLDVWVNLFQRLVETMLFYHPAIWWLSRRLRSEREFCCDDLAVAATGGRLTYALALARAYRSALGAPQPALAAGLGAHKRTVLARVRHVLGLVPSPARSRWWLAGALALLSVLAVLVGMGISFGADEGPTASGATTALGDSPQAQPGGGAVDQPHDVAGVMASLKAELVKLSADYPELVGAKAIRVSLGSAGTSHELLYWHNCKYRTKGAYEDTGPSAVHVGFRVMRLQQFHEAVHKVQMQIPTHRWASLNMVGWTALHIGEKPSSGLAARMQALLKKHVKMLDYLDRRAARAAALAGVRSSGQISPGVVGERDKLVAEAGEKIRKGLIKLAERFPQLKKSAEWQRVVSPLEGPPGWLELRLYHNSPKRGPDLTPELQRFGVTVDVRPPPPPAATPIPALYPNLGLVGRVDHVQAGDPQLDAALKELVADALASLKRLNDRAARSQPTVRSRPPRDSPQGTQPATRPAKAGSFNAVVERLVAAREPWIDLDRNVTTRPSASFYRQRKTRAGEMRWLLDNGIDAAVEIQHKGLGCLDATAVRLKDEAWDTFTPEQLERALRAGKKVPRAGDTALAVVYLKGTDGLPATYAFRTREGGVGLLQMVEWVERPLGLQIRYKILPGRELERRPQWPAPAPPRPAEADSKPGGSSQGNLPPLGVELSRTPGVSIVRVQAGRGRGSSSHGSSRGKYHLERWGCPLLEALVEANRDRCPIVQSAPLPGGEYRIVADTQEGGYQKVLEMLCEAYSRAFRLRVSQRTIEMDVLVMTCPDAASLKLKPSAKKSGGFLHKTTGNGAWDCPFTGSMADLAWYAGYMLRKESPYRRPSQRGRALATAIVDETALPGLYDGHIRWHAAVKGSMLEALKGLGLAFTPAKRKVQAVVVQGVAAHPATQPARKEASP